jgi:hypothetical protein
MTMFETPDGRFINPTQPCDYCLQEATWDVRVHFGTAMLKILYTCNKHRRMARTAAWSSSWQGIKASHVSQQYRAAF